MAENLRNLLGHERKCDVCKKQFIIHPGWVYKKGVGDGTKVFCSWHCLRNFEKRKLNKAEQRDAIIDRLIEGETITEIADKLGCDSRQIYYWKKKLEKDGVI